MLPGPGIGHKAAASGHPVPACRAMIGRVSRLGRPCRLLVHSSASVAEAPAAAALPHSATQTEGRRQSGSQASASGREEKTEGVELIYGPMFAGKTTFLVAQLRAWRLKAGRGKLLVAKSSLDNRYDSLSGDGTPQLQTGHIVTHNGDREACFAVAKLKDLQQHQDYEEAELICIDEAHFLPDLVEFCVEASKTKRVIVAGLDLDFKRQPIGGVLALKAALPSGSLDPFALQARCAVCEETAQYTRRTVASQQQILVGSSDVYQAVCEKHHTVS